jgi:enolase
MAASTPARTDAAKEAKPIFVSAIKSMTIQDAWAILKGEDNAATEYLKRVTSAQLKEKFKPVIQNSLNKVNATKYYGDLVTRYNKIPLVDKVNPDLDDYATDKAIDGLFTMIAKEEKNIRQDPVARTTELLKKVFGYKK